MDAISSSVHSLGRLSLLPVVSVALIACLFSTWMVSAADAEAPRPTDQARDEYLRNFKRIGLNTTPGDAMLLRILVQASGAKRGVEIGTATGYGALHMGIGFERTGGQLVTIDIDPAMVKTARAHVRELGLEKTVTVIEGDALKVLATLEGEFDFVFIDALKADYFKYYQRVAPKLKRGALVVADNVIQSAAQMKDFLDFMEASPEFEKVTLRASLEKNDGLAVYLKVK